MTRPRSAALALLCCLPLALMACSSAPAARTEPEPAPLPDQPPADFVLSVTILGPAGTAAEVDATPRPLRPARYLVEPDGVLRAAIGPGATPRVYPGETRRLTDAQVRRLWRLTAVSGLLDEGTLTRIDNTEIFFPSRDRSTALLYVKHGGVNSHHAVRLPVGDAESRAVTTLIDHLAELAWIPE